MLQQCEPISGHREVVGYGVDYDRLGAQQFGVMIEQGLREHHSVLDVGCGPLRLGRILIPWLQKGKYHGVEPDSFVVSEALKHEVGRETSAEQYPRFNTDRDFQFHEFGVQFDYVMIHSVFIHMPMSWIRKCLIESRKVLADGGAVLFTYKEGPTTDERKLVSSKHLTHSTQDIVMACKNADFLPTYLHYHAPNFNHQWVQATAL